MLEIGIEHSDTEGVNDSVIEPIRNVLLEILARYPVDSILSHKFVCKSWHGLIRSQDFINLHLKHSHKNVGYILCCLAEDSTGTDLCLMNNNGEITTIFPLSEFLKGAYLRVVSSFNGLLFMTCDLRDNGLFIFTCNLATRKVHAFPNGRPSAVKPTIGVAFDLKKCQYKIFRFFKELLESDEDYYACEVYAPVSGSWRRIDRVKYRPLVTPFSSSNDHVSVDGTIYWLGCPKEDQRATVGSACIMSINMNDEKLRTINFPGCLQVTQFSFLINLEGELSLVTVDCPNLCICRRGHGRPASPAQAHLWLAEDLGQSKWSLKTSFKIHVDGIYNFKSVVARKNDIFFIIADVKDVLHYHIYHVADSNWTVIDLPQNGYDRSLWEWPVAFPFAESLCPCVGVA